MLRRNSPLVVALLACVLIPACDFGFLHPPITLRGSNVADGDPPAAPANATATAGVETIRIDWEAQDDATSFTIYWSTSPEVAPNRGAERITNVSQPFTHNSLTPGLTYYYVITATNAAGESEPSQEISAAPTTCAPRAAPTNLTAVLTGPMIAVSWQHDAPETEGFVVYRQRKGFEWGELRRITDPLARGFDDDSIMDDVRYSYRISARRGSCETPPSEIVDVWTPPIEPAAFAATPLGAKTIELSWVDQSNAETAYVIERSTGGAPFVEVATTESDETAYLDQALTPDTTYDYRVRASGDGGESNRLSASAKTTGNPTLEWVGSPYSTAGCGIVLPGAVHVRSNPALAPAFQSASATIVGASNVVANESGVSATIDTTGFGASTMLSVAWTALDNLGGMATLVRDLLFTRQSGATRSSPRLPTLALDDDRQEGRQAFAPGCVASGTCTGRRASVSAGYDHTCFVTQDGYARCFGSNNSNRLGNNLSTFSFSPMPVCEAPGRGPTCEGGSEVTNAAAVAVTKTGGCVLHGTTVACWGADDFGSIGDGVANLPKDWPATITLPPITKIRSGSSRACALTATGELRCWGRNDWGQTIPGGAIAEHAPVTAPCGNLCTGTLTGVTDFDLGETHSCAIIGSGPGAKLRCWGKTDAGQIDSQIALTRPGVDICVTGFFGPAGCTGPSGALDDVTAVSAGVLHTCALRSGSIDCWGSNAFGQLGDGTATQRFNPTRVCQTGSGGTCVPLTNATAVSAGEVHSCAIVAGEAVCWGDGEKGQLGNGAFSNTQSNPVKVCRSGTATGMSCSGTAMTGVSRIAVAGTHSCAIFDDGSGAQVACWGENKNRVLGFEGPNTALATVVPGISGATDLDVSTDHTCVVHDSGGGPRVKCFGANENHQLGNGDWSNQRHPQPVCETGAGDSCATGERLANVIAVAAGEEHSCALVDRGGGTRRAVCWGSEVEGRLGNGNSSGELRAPAEVIGMGGDPVEDVRALTVSKDDAHGFSCLLTSDGVVRCFGSNEDKGLGDPSVTGASAQRTRAAPVRCRSESGPGCAASGDVFGPAVAVSAGFSHACAVTATGRLYCWGDGTAGKLGNGTGDPRDAATPVCDGVLPITATAGCPTPLTGAVSVAVGLRHTCALMADSSVRCFGSNDNGALGIGVDTGAASLPKPVCATGTDLGCVPLTGVVAISAGGLHSCALLQDGTVRCWGMRERTGTSRAEPNIVNPTTVCLSGLGDATGCGPGGVALTNVVAISSGSSHSCAERSDGSLYCWGSNNALQTGDIASNNVVTVPNPICAAPACTPFTSAASQACDVYTVSAP